jgi:hypothetical protein
MWPPCCTRRTTANPSNLAPNTSHPQHAALRPIMWPWGRRAAPRMSVLPPPTCRSDSPSHARVHSTPIGHALWHSCFQCRRPTACSACGPLPWPATTGIGLNWVASAAPHSPPLLSGSPVAHGQYSVGPPPCHRPQPVPAATHTSGRRTLTQTGCRP